MIIILYLSVALIAIAFLFLVISLSRTLKSVSVTLDHVAGTVKDLESQMQGITNETTKILQSTNDLVADIQHKSEKLNTVVDAVEDIGVSATQLSQTLRRVTTTVSSTVGKKQEKIAQALQWGAAIKNIRDKWAERKPKHTTIPETSQRSIQEEPVQQQRTRLRQH
ncbi:DUF948 domain-containing protein [Heyndrickxia ginsengihumi]|uniref:DUF948 domain-containing protein n=1 Tax=Heyndrickxia ginsengihumi TaxID=363870 RepID=A0A0A6VCH6_9BACI|nr:DUF948 domain-containing protein [Heyndrickxia ginsengihumi]KHD84234.1 hypothetical protein NG54_16870 [Heyndrickxia ginsengihumi]MBE6182635.1 DUF948 domain-containing protein [Bacillus sp. (in: firmicutes)]MCM3022053.1 DUF948 domain-containing protein [Heyndrickxia ginsengihumi]NEY21535.1 DUF948 domain-containing protein [Heyndrickxia ginsengihumi]